MYPAHLAIGTKRAVKLNANTDTTFRVQRGHFFYLWWEFSSAKIRPCDPMHSCKYIQAIRISILMIINYLHLHYAKLFVTKYIDLIL